MPSGVTHQGGLQGSKWFLQQLRALLFDFSQPFSIVLQGKRHGGARCSLTIVGTWGVILLPTWCAEMERSGSKASRTSLVWASAKRSCFSDSSWRVGERRAALSQSMPPEGHILSAACEGQDRGAMLFGLYP